MKSLCRGRDVQRQIVIFRVAVCEPAPSSSAAAAAAAVAVAAAVAGAGAGAVAATDAGTTVPILHRRISVPRKPQALTPDYSPGFKMGPVAMTGAAVKTMNIGRLAELADVRVDTIRYYERQALLPAPTRTAAGYRQYEDADLKRLRFIRRSKALGFSLAEIRDLLSLTQDRHSDMRGVRLKAEQRLIEVERKIDELRRVRRGLKKLLDVCPGEGELSGCPIVAALSGRDGRSGVHE